MKKILSVLAMAAMIIMASCKKEETGGNETPETFPEIEGVSGIGAEYELEQYQSLSISPEVKFSKGEEKDIKYE